MPKTIITISQLQQDIINNSQKGFPLTSQPFQTISEQLASVNIITTEQEVFQAIDELNKLGVLSRVGPVFDHKKAGASTLAALAVPPKELDNIADIVNKFEQVNHNYGRESDSKKENYNLWFVVTASDMEALNNTLTSIELQTGLAVLRLPMQASYHIDLAFSINVTGVESPTCNQLANKVTSKVTGKVMSADELPTPLLTDSEKVALRNTIEQGLPVNLSPYQVIAEQLKLTEQQVLQQISLWQQAGLIRRFGLVIKHRILGYDANAMVVWNIANNDMDEIAQKLAKCAPVSLCYQRPRRLPDWPYNLFCMIHGTDRGLVLQQIRQITEQLGLQAIEKDILFSFKAYKQHGARYRKENSNKQISNTQVKNKTQQHHFHTQGQAHG